jgi:hypothetical protein
MSFPAVAQRLPYEPRTYGHVSILSLGTIVAHDILLIEIDHYHSVVSVGTRKQSKYAVAQRLSSVAVTSHYFNRLLSSFLPTKTNEQIDTSVFGHITLILTLQVDCNDE